MQWADASLLDFVEYLLEWSRSSPLFVLVLARPELLEKRASWGAGRRNFTALHLDPLSEQAMVQLLDGFVPGLPDELREQILVRAEGVPLYAVETVRMLLDRGLLVQEGSVYRPTGAIPSLEVPETLHGLVASRLDGLPPEERRLLQDAAVLGKTFTRQALAAVAGSDEAAPEPLLASLVRKEILGVQSDPTSPEHGQYGFLQDLVRHVAYETLSKRERRSRHLTAAKYLESAFGNEDELSEVVASHYLDAYAALPDADDALEVRASARAALVRAGERADSLGAAGEALRYFEQAAGLTDDPLERAVLVERAGWLSINVPDWPGAERRLAEAIALCEAQGQTRAAARVSGRLAIVESWQGKTDDAIPRAEAAFAALESFEPGEEMAAVAATLASNYAFRGESEKALEKAELALELAQAFGTPELLVRAFSAKALATHGTRPQEALALRKHQLSLTREHDLPELETNALFNLSDLCFQGDRYEEALAYLSDARAVARRRGSRPGEWSVLGETTYPLFMLGRWDEALAVFAEVPEERLHEGTTESFLSTIPEIHIARGDIDRAARVLALYAPYETSENLQRRSMYLASASSVAAAEGRLEEAIDLGLEATRLSRDVGGDAFQQVKLGLVTAIEAELALGRRDRADELVASIEAVPRGLRSPYLGAQAERFRARLAEGEGAEERFAAAKRAFRALGTPFWLAVALLEHGGLTGDESSLDEARETFEHLGARPWLERLAQAPGSAVRSVATGARP
jgi:tetratricopeptide (TPR) repeat protein